MVFTSHFVQQLAHSVMSSRATSPIESAWTLHILVKCGLTSAVIIRMGWRMRMNSAWTNRHWDKLSSCSSLLWRKQALAGCSTAHLPFCGHYVSPSAEIKVMSVLHTQCKTRLQIQFQFQRGWLGQVYSYLPSTYRYQIILHSNRGTCISMVY